MQEKTPKTFVSKKNNISLQPQLSINQIRNMKINNLLTIATATVAISFASIIASCSEIDDPVKPQLSDDDPAELTTNYSIEQLKKTVEGGWVDEILYMFDDVSTLYDITEDGKCAVYDLWEEDWIETEESDVDTDDEDLHISLREGTWTVVNSGPAINALKNFDTTGLEVMGALILQTEPSVTDADEGYQEYINLKSSGYDLNRFDTLSIIKDKEDGSIFFISKRDIDYLNMLQYAEYLNDTPSLARVLTRASESNGVSSEIEKKIEEITQKEGINTKNFVNPLINKSSEVDMSDWMGTFYKGLNPRICDISIPGAHDACTGYYNTIFSCQWVCAQHKKLEELWSNGVRYFDIRVREKDGKLETYHLMKLGISFEDVLKKMDELLTAHPDEMAILIINFDDGNNPKMVHDELQKFVNDRVLWDAKPGLRLNDCRGKILVMNRYNEDAGGDYSVGPSLRAGWDTSTGHWAKMKYPDGSEEPYYLQDDYSIHADNAPRKYNGIANTWKVAAANANAETPAWIINHESGYSFRGNEKVNMSYKINSERMNPHVEKLLSVYRGEKSGVVVLDFVGVEKAANADPHGSFTARLVALNNYFLVKSHRISLNKGDEPSTSSYTITVDKSSGGEPSNYEAKNLFDQDYRTEWHSNPRSGNWFVEFHTSTPISPKSYAFITGNDSGTCWDRTPKVWRVLGKQNASDDWTILSDLDFNRDKGEAWIAGEDRVRTPDFKFNVNEPKDMKYFRLEIIQNFGSDAVQLNEMMFNNY